MALIYVMKPSRTTCHQAENKNGEPNVENQIPFINAWLEESLLENTGRKIQNLLQRSFYRVQNFIF
jgi:hypothetical protein